MIDNLTNILALYIYAVYFLYTSKSFIHGHCKGKRKWKSLFVLTKKKKKANNESPNTLAYYFSMKKKFEHLPIHKFSLMYFFWGSYCPLPLFLSASISVPLRRYSNTPHFFLHSFLYRGGSVLLVLPSLLSIFGKIVLMTVKKIELDTHPNFLQEFNGYFTRL